MNEETRRCPHCGRYVIAQDDICPACGEPLSASEEEGAPVPDAAEAIAEPNETEATDVPASPEDAAPPEAVAAADAPDADETEAAEPPSAEEAAAEVETPEAEAASAEHTDEGEPSPAESVAEEAAAEAADAPEGPPEKPPSLPDTLGTPDAVIPPVTATPLGEQSTPPRAMTPPAAMPPVAAALAETGEHEAVPSLPTPADMMQETQPNLAAQMQPAAPAYIIPPAPYTPPPLPAPAYALAPYAYAQPADPLAAAVAFLQQRVALYRQGGYHLVAHGPYEATLAYGKGLSVGAWMLALVSGVGLVWYLLLLALSGFQPDEVTIWVERDGRVYEDGPGAAHVRAQRARAGRRWRTIGAVIFALSLFVALVLGVFAGAVLSQERYQAALRQAYPAVTLFEERFSDAPASADDVQLAKDGAVAFGVVAVLAAVGLWGGATLFVVGTVHASAYRVHVPPLPGWA